MLTDYHKTIFSRSTVGRGVRKAGFKGGGGVKLPFSGFCKIAACAKLGVTLKRLRDLIMLLLLPKNLVCLMISLEQC